MSSEKNPNHAKLQTEIDIKPPQPPPFLIAGEDTFAVEELSFFKPGSSTKRRRHRGDTWMVSVFVIVHVVAFAVTMFVNDCWRNSNEDCAVKALGRFSFQPISENPLLGPSASTLDEMGALRRRFLEQDHQKWRLFAFPCLHAGAVHLIINLGGVILVGIHLEQEFGPFMVCIIYVLSAFAGTMVASLFVSNKPVVGSSGALFGLIGAALSELIFNWRFYTDKFLALASLLVVSVVTLALGLVPYVDNFSSIGGFVSGILLGSALLCSHVQTMQQQIPPNKGDLFEYRVKSSVRMKMKLKQKLSLTTLRTCAILVIFCLLFAGCVVAVLHGLDMNKYCKWCRYVDCVPTKVWSCEDKAAFCETMVSNEELTLTCLSNGKFRVFPFTNVSQSRMNDLCFVICSLNQS